MLDKKFCKGCGRKLNESPLPAVYGERVYEFEDGFYCEICGKAIVKKRREKLNK
ncbi:MAG: hypothetical protein WC679_12465 [Bacteroidales bacterium]|jgi:hypothetical protein